MTTLVAVTLAGSIAGHSIGHRQDMDRATLTVDKAADASDVRLFASASGKKASSCFVRHYDADICPIPARQDNERHSFPVWRKERRQPGDFAAIATAPAPRMPDIRVDCERWWHNVALSRNDKSALTLRDLLPGVVSAEKRGMLRLAEPQSERYPCLKP
jgi:hypothetical protein